MQNIRLSPHFELHEFIASKMAKERGINNTPPLEAVGNLQVLCVRTLEPLREALGMPIIITSGYRTKALNNLLAHSSDRSQHMLGQAADFFVAPGPVSGSNIQESGEQNHETGASPMALETSSRRELLIKAFRLIILDESIDYDQLILYPSFIHVSNTSRERNRHNILLGMRNGKLGYGKCSIQNALKIQ